MNPVKFAGANTVYNAPGCDPLPAMRSEHEEAKGVTVTSVWKPTAEDLEILNNGGCVCLSIWGGQPPVSMWTQEVNIVD